MLDSDRVEIRNLLLRMAFSDDTPASRAVLLSLLAFASQHRNGHNKHAAQMKFGALRALIASTEKGISAKAGIQHIAAGMLLCAFEVSFLPS